MYILWQVAAFNHTLEEVHCKGHRLENVHARDIASLTRLYPLLTWNTANSPSTGVSIFFKIKPSV